MDDSGRGTLAFAPEDETIYLNKGMPSDDILGRHLLEASLRDLSCASHLSTFQLLNYGDDGGPLSFREALCGFLHRQHAEVVSGSFRPFRPEDVFGTAGNSNAVNVLCTMLLHDSPSTVLCDDPTYPFALVSFRDHRATLVGIPQAGEGQSDVAAMRRQCEIARSEKRLVKIVYVIPSFHNPTGGVMSNETRRALVDLAHEYDFFLLCDDVYQLLHFVTPAPPACVCLEQDLAPEKCRVLSLGSFSKICAPAMRVGWLHTFNASIIERMHQFGELQSGGGYSALSTRIAEQLLRSGRLDELLPTIRSRLRTKSSFLCDSLSKHLGNAIEFDRPQGGYFVWVRLTKPGLTAEAVLEKCLSLKPVAVKFFPGSLFSPNRICPSHLRLSFALYDEDRLEAGVMLLAKSIKSLL